MNDAPIVATEVLEPDELDALLDQVSTRGPSGARNLALLTLMARTGIRCGEALGIMAGDIRREEWPGYKSQVWVLRLPRRVTKGQIERIGLPLGNGVVAALQGWWGWRDRLGLKRGPLFCTVSHGTRNSGMARDGGELKPGEALDARYVRALVARLAKRAGITRRVHPHMLRHTALTGLYDRTGDLRLVQAAAGHTTPTHTVRYTHVHPRALAEAMGVSDEEGAGDE